MFLLKFSDNKLHGSCTFTFRRNADFHFIQCKKEESLVGILESLVGILEMKM